MGDKTENIGSPKPAVTNPEYAPLFENISEQLDRDNKGRKEDLFKIKLHDKETKTTATTLANGERRVQFKYVIDTNTKREDGRVYFIDTFVFGRDGKYQEDKFTRIFDYPRDIEHANKLKKWTARYFALGDPPIAAQRLFAEKVARSLVSQESPQVIEVPTIRIVVKERRIIFPNMRITGDGGKSPSSKVPSPPPRPAEPAPKPAPSSAGPSTSPNLGGLPQAPRGPVVPSRPPKKSSGSTGRHYTFTGFTVKAPQDRIHEENDSLSGIVLRLVSAQWGNLANKYRAKLKMMTELTIDNETGKVTKVEFKNIQIENNPIPEHELKNFLGVFANKIYGGIRFRKNGSDRYYGVNIPSNFVTREY